MRARGRGMTWWARTAQKSGSRLLPNAAVPVWLSSALKGQIAAPDAGCVGARGSSTLGSGAPPRLIQPTRLGW